MGLSKEKVMRDAKRFLKRTEAFQKRREMEGGKNNFKVDFVLSKDHLIIAIACTDENAIMFDPYNTENSIVDLWAFSYERDLFNDLNNGYEIVGMSLECHSGVWNCIEKYPDTNSEFPESLDKFPVGVKKYLEYCKKNGITMELLQEKVSHVGIDVTALYKEAPLPGMNSTNKRDDLER